MSSGSVDLFLHDYERDLCACLRDSTRGTLEMVGEGGGGLVSREEEWGLGREEVRGTGQELRGWSGSLVLGSPCESTEEAR